MSSRPARRLGLATGLGILGLVGAGPAVRAANPNALWQIVHGECVPDQQANNDAAPCASVQIGAGEARGHAILKDIVGASQFLLIPTGRIGGIESPELLAPDAPNYFADAWAARFETERALHRDLMPRDDLGLAINSVSGRTQNQLHIHIDCLRPDVIAALHAHAAAIGTAWAPLPGGLLGHPYVARRIEGDALSENPFRLLADGVPAAAADMAHETLVVAGVTSADGAPGFVLLADRVDPARGDFGAGEELLDHACAVAAPDRR